MGTNFYCRRINKEKRDELKLKFNELYEELLKSIDDIDLDFKTILNNFIWDNKDLEQEIHLGKRSAGWQFLWDYHDGIYFKPTLASIKEFLSDKDLIIYDEYGKQYSVDEFFTEIGPWLYNDEHHIDGSEPGKHNIYDWNTHFFASDGLRFSKFEDFS